MKKKIISSVLRKMKLISFSDKIRFYIKYLSTIHQRKKFFQANPNIKIPPAYYIYETFNLNYYSFYNKSIETAERVASFLGKYKKVENLSILDWGCGPGRVIRHLPKYINESCKFYGTDYNIKYVEWCQKNIENISFSVNKLEPPLLYPDEKFDFIYGISIFTHLSEEMHLKWIKELFRVLKSGGMLYITFQGDAFIQKLTIDERKKYEEGKIVIRSNTKEGHRTYSAFQPRKYIEVLLGDSLKIIEVVSGELINERPQQDLYIIEKI